MQVDAKTPLWLAARALLHERGDDFFRRKERVLKGFNAEEIHDLRVSSRRLREGVELFSPCYPPDSIAPLVRIVRKVTRLLGEIRNADEALLFLAELAQELDGPCRLELESLTHSLQKVRKKELRKLKTGLSAAASDKLRNRYRHVVNSPSLFSPPPSNVDLFAPLGAFAARSFDERLAAVQKHRQAASMMGGAEARHQLRIAVKHFRYRMEILSFLLGAFAELHPAVKGYQEVLGKLHDLDVFAGLVRTASFSSRSEAGILNSIGARREKYFLDFLSMVESMPLEMIGAQVKKTLLR